MWVYGISRKRHPFRPVFGVAILEFEYAVLENALVFLGLRNRDECTTEREGEDRSLHEMALKDIDLANETAMKKELLVEMRKSAQPFSLLLQKTANPPSL